MPSLAPPRKGFAPKPNCYLGFRDKVGHTVRPGRAVYCLAAYDKWGGLPAGEIPVRLYRLFSYPGDRLGAYRLDAEYTWTLNHSMLLALGPNVIGKVDEDILAEMEQDPRKVVETNWAVADEFETLMGDVEMRATSTVRRRRARRPTSTWARCSSR